MEKDDIYQRKTVEPGSFRFDDQVVEVFPDMINRSVPGYGLIVPMIGQLARRYAQANTVIHDLGCSLGAASLSIRARVAAENVRILATDNSQAMVERFRKRLESEPAELPVEVIHGDIRDTVFSNASVVVLNFTLQFVPPGERTPLMRRIADGLVDGGVIILSEKIRFEDDPTQGQQTSWHEDFKRLQGYSELEIARKRSALEKVLEPETEARHVQRLQEAGLCRVTRWFQCFGFCSFLAEK